MPLSSAMGSSPKNTDTQSATQSGSTWTQPTQLRYYMPLSSAMGSSPKNTDTHPPPPKKKLPLSLGSNPIFINFVKN